MNTTPRDPAPVGLGGSARRLSTVRIVCGVIWAAIALTCAAGAIGEVTIHNAGGAILSGVIAVGSAWYDYRVWTLRARRLILIIGMVWERRAP
ncbi:MAG TPA: hypothetical protein VLX31_03060 [Streptosporangiaceae bacterium]|nr:hypothetical protein [Streptosporangiaceae bacterium]